MEVSSSAELEMRELSWKTLKQDQHGGEGVNQCIIKVLLSIKQEQKRGNKENGNMKKTWPDVAGFEDGKMTSWGS